MPSNSRPNRSTGSAAFVLGDCHGTTCAPEVTQTVEQVLSGKDYLVVRNTPYAGGFVTRHYGKPDRKSVVWGKSVAVRVDLGGRRIINKQQTRTRYEER